MAKRTKRREGRELTRKQRSRVERERRMERLLIAGLAVVGVAVAGLLVYALAIYPAILARKPVALVDGDPITVAEFQGYIRYGRLLSASSLNEWQTQKLLASSDADDATLEQYDSIINDLRQQLSEENATAFASQALERLIEFELGRLEADRRSIAVTEEEVQRQIELSFGYDRDAEASLSEEPAEPTPTPAATSTPALTPSAEITGTSEITPSDEITSTTAITPTPAPTPLPTPTPMSEASFREQYRGTMSNTMRPLRISEDMYRSWIESDIVLAEVQAAMASEYPTTTEQIELRYISTQDEEQANRFAARLQESESYDAITEEIDSITETVESAPTHAELPWYPRSVIDDLIGHHGASLVDLVFELEVGTYTDPVLSEDGTTYLVFSVLGHEEERELGSYLLDYLIEQAYQNWLLEMKEQHVEMIPYADSIVPRTP
jgi:hypothetical protein